MSSRSGFKCIILPLTILLYIPVPGSLDKSLVCHPQTICALRESKGTLKCSYPNISIKRGIWISPKQKDTWRDEDHPDDLNSDPDYTERVSNTNLTRFSSTLTITDLRHSDSGLYHFLLITENEEKYSETINLTVTDLQLRINPDQSGHRVNLTCSTSCHLTNEPNYYFWYKNTKYMKKYTSYKIPKPLVLSSRADSGKYTCSVAVDGHLKSPAVDVPEDSLTVHHTTRNKEYYFKFTTQSGREFSDSPGFTDPGSTEEPSLLKYSIMGVAIFLALILIIGVLWTWRRKSSSAKGHGRTVESEQSDTTSPLATSWSSSQKAASPGDGEIQYTSIHFTHHHRQEESLLPPVKLPLDTTEGDTVQYAAVNFRRDTAATQ